LRASAPHAEVKTPRSVSCFGPLDLRAQANIASALRPDTPRSVKGCLWHSDVDDPL
jgi:hypothetical protein